MVWFSPQMSLILSCSRFQILLVILRLLLSWWNNFGVFFHAFGMAPSKQFSKVLSYYIFRIVEHRTACKTSHNHGSNRKWKLSPIVLNAIRRNSTLFFALFNGVKYVFLFFNKKKSKISNFYVPFSINF